MKNLNRFGLDDRLWPSTADCTRPRAASAAAAPFWTFKEAAERIAKRAIQLLKLEDERG